MSLGERFWGAASSECNIYIVFGHVLYWCPPGETEENIRKVHTAISMAIAAARLKISVFFVSVLCMKYFI